MKRAARLRMRKVEPGSGPDSDNDLIERCIAGDQSAWKELVARYERLVYSVARALCPPGEEISDVFQQVWLDFYQQLGQLRNVGALPAWLITVTKRHMYALLRLRRGSEPLEEDVPDLSQKIRQIENEHLIERALEQSPDRCRA